jgi:hypothetical protein
MGARTPWENADEKFAKITNFRLSFHSACIFSDWREISADYRTTHPVHCKEKNWKIFKNFFVLKV